MFGMSWPEIAIIIAVGMFVLGPERIPVAVKWVGSTLKTVRTMAAGAQEQLRGEFGPEIDELRRQIADLQSLKEIQELRALRDLNPRSMITKNLLGDEFSGGVKGLLGLDGLTDMIKPTGSGVADEAPAVDLGKAVQFNGPTADDPPSRSTIRAGSTIRRRCRSIR
jgi:sec-independent protein translocase protein TatB